MKKKGLRAVLEGATVFAAVLAMPARSFAQLKVIASGGFSAAYRELLPEFENATGIKVTTTSGASVGGGANTIPADQRDGTGETAPGLENLKDVVGHSVRLPFPDSGVSW